MKTLLKGIAAAIVILALIGLLGAVNDLTSHYTMEVKVVSVEGDEISLEDSNGNVWVYEDSSNTYTVGQRLEARMCGMGTDDTIYDDEILDLN